MKFLQIFIEWMAGRLKIPPEAVKMFKVANEMSGIDKSTLPTELVPLNSMQLSRGLLNFTVLQSNMNWLFPYWAEEQYNPGSSSFIPRSHIGLSINVTHRNWTAVGIPGCTIEPVVDPRGMVMPFRNGWSVDVWLSVDGRNFFPSKSSEASQKLIDDVPVVETSFVFQEVKLNLKTFVGDSTLVHKAKMLNESGKVKKCRLVFALRPFNPEGISLTHDIVFNKAAKGFNVSNKYELKFNIDPDIVSCASYIDGDISNNINDLINNYSVHCETGMANAAAAFDRAIDADCSIEIESHVELTNTPSIKSSSLKEEDALNFWDDVLSRGAMIKTPDEKINSVIKSSVSSLLLFSDDKHITPGPFTYHQFWFRDAAYMIWALDKWGFSNYTSPVIKSFPEYQSDSGYFRSQKGEWDSNGQAVWSAYQHAMLSYNKKILEELFENFYKGIIWIDKNRLTGDEYKDKPYYGLLPPGMSAEHLGLADHYFWDSFWSIAGIESFINICNLLNRQKEKDYSENLLSNYRKDFDRALSGVQKKFGLKTIPASPNRKNDCGMIGSVAVSYPLQIMGFEDPSVAATLETLYSSYFVKGMFFQQFIHSGMNAYLTLHVAHAYLYAGERKKFWEIITNTLKFISPTSNFPEAINPLTGGGVMGDGHHGWASAELLMAFTEAFVYEYNIYHPEKRDVMFLQGVPEEWFNQGSSFGINRIHIFSGIISMEIKCEDNTVRIEVDFEKKGEVRGGRWFFKLPSAFELIKYGENNVHAGINEKNETIIETAPGSLTINLIRLSETHSLNVKPREFVKKNSN